MRNTCKDDSQYTRLSHSLALSKAGHYILPSHNSHVMRLCFAPMQKSAYICIYTPSPAKENHPILQPETPHPSHSSSHTAHTHLLLRRACVQTNRHGPRTRRSRAHSSRIQSTNRQSKIHHHQIGDGTILEEDVRSGHRLSCIGTYRQDKTRQDKHTWGVFFAEKVNEGERERERKGSKADTKYIYTRRRKAVDGTITRRGN